MKKSKLKNKLSLLSIFVIMTVLVVFRFNSPNFKKGEGLKVTTWDAFGYYMYLPGTFIYNDVTELKWLDKIEDEYELTGGFLYQANIHSNGNYVFKYLGGVAVLESPFFAVGHLIALNSDYKADGFSAPYQYSIAFGALIYAFLALLLLRSVLLNYFKDSTVTLTLLFLTLATNFVQYIAIDGGQSHAYIFPLYALLLFATMKWHQKPSYFWSAVIGLTIGLATISRPTEAIMIFIPILWGTQTKELKREKWAMVKANKQMVLMTILFGIIGILPQLIYWKIASGSFVYDVGSKWFFLNPWFRVLFGFENGWFIYTPITIFFIIGMFYIKSFPFKKSVIVFCLLNIWIVIAWSDWKYGSTYSTRALVQSYPLFALALGGFIHSISSKIWKSIFILVGIYLIFLNFFQIHQYGETILHSRDMNRQYYAAIYLDANPTPMDMSLLDTDEKLPNSYSLVTNEPLIFSINSPLKIVSKYDSIGFLMKQEVETKGAKNQWVIVSAKIKSFKGMSSSYLNCKVYSEYVLKEKSFRLYTPISTEGEINDYQFVFQLPETNEPFELSLFIVPSFEYEGEVEKLNVRKVNL